MQNMNTNIPEQLIDLLEDDSFVRYLMGKATEEELLKWSDWEKQSDENAEILRRAHNLLQEGAHTIPKPDSRRELERLKSRIESDDRYMLFHYAQKRRKRLVWATMAAAAGILLVVGFLTRNTFFQNDETETVRNFATRYQTVSTDFGKRTTITYSDGSEIVLNAQSQLRLPNRAVGKDTMQVWLEGEAYFSIARKKPENARTFIVHTEEGDISVLGTRFVVNTREEHTSVVLEEGSVQLDIPKSQNRESLQHKMVPGELALFSRTLDTIELSRVNTQIYTSWVSDSLILDNTPLRDLIRRIESTYGVKIEVKPPRLLNERVTGKLNNVKLDPLLEGLAKTMDVTIRKDEQKITIEK